MIEQGSLSFVIKHCNGKAPINGGFNMIRIFKWGIFHCSVSLNIIFGGHKKKNMFRPQKKGKKATPRKPTLHHAHKMAPSSFMVFQFLIPAK